MRRCVVFFLLLLFINCPPIGFRALLDNGPDRKSAPSLAPDSTGLGSPADGRVARYGVRVVFGRARRHARNRGPSARTHRIVVAGTSVTARRAVRRERKTRRRTQTQPRERNTSHTTADARTHSPGRNAVAAAADVSPAALPVARSPAHDRGPRRGRRKRARGAWAAEVGFEAGEPEGFSLGQLGFGRTVIENPASASVQWRIVKKNVF